MVCNSAHHNAAASSLPAPQAIDGQIAGGTFINKGGFGEVYKVRVKACDARGRATGATKCLAVKLVAAKEDTRPEHALDLVYSEVLNYVKLQGNPAVLKVRALHTRLPGRCMPRSLPPFVAAATPRCSLLAPCTFYGHISSCL